MESSSGSKRKALNFDDKLKIIKLYDEKKGVMNKQQFANEQGLPVSSLKAILKKRDEIEENAFSVISKRRRVRKGKNEELEDILYQWFQQARASNVTINGPIMTEKANEIAKSLNVTDFSGSTGWLDRFRKRFGINYRKISGEAETVNDDTIAPRIENLLPNLLKDYSSDDVYKRCKAMRCKERWRGIRDTYKRGLNKKRINEHKSNKYTDFPLEFLVEHVTDQRARGPSKQAGPPENEVALVKVEPPSPGDNSTVSEDFILPDHLNEEIASESDPNSSSTKSGPDQPLVVLPQSNDRPQLSRMLVVRRTPTPSGTPTTGVQQPFVVVGNDGLAKTSTAVVMNANASSQPQFVMMPTTAQQQQFVVVGPQQQVNTGNNNSNNDVTSPQQFVVVGQQQGNTSNSNNKNDVTSPQQFVVVGHQQQGKTNNKNVKVAASSVPPKVSSGRKKKKKRVVEESDDSDGENPVDSFFRSMAQTVKKFPPLLVAEAKMEVCRVVTRLECEMLKGRFDQPSNSNSFVCDSASEPKKEESILGYSLFS